MVNLNATVLDLEAALERVRELEQERDTLREQMNTKYWDQVREDNKALKSRADAADARLRGLREKVEKQRDWHGKHAGQNENRKDTLTAEMHRVASTAYHKVLYMLDEIDAAATHPGRADDAGEQERGK